ncbi:MAG TPA: hypothetical protein VE954_04290 [Oligoflexus sp.]|uniref:hypothetical protein n=1 Tax=Oligoflexus sp. TaxID=1971216 RepID=UPI002D69678B|nr:hypothetical protein [Oligoflexus sp.]HYX32308.1 hypothetical protein [Oligoflexus sp.]
MGLMIAIAQPQQADHESAWYALGVHDPTRISPEHERTLLANLGNEGAQIVVIYQDDKPILRFLVHDFLPDEGTTCLGFFAMAPDAPDAMLQEGFQQALQKLEHPSRRKWVGPMNGSTWFAYRLRVDQHPLQLDWEPQSQPRLQELFKTAGFQAWAHYHSTATVGLKTMQDYLYKDWKRVVENGFSLRPITGKELQGGALLELHRLSQIGFADNPLFAALSFEAFARSYLQGKSSKENFLYMACEPLGRTVAFFLAFLEPPHAGQTQKTLVLKTAATDPQYRRQGLSNALLYAITQDLPTDISDAYISALVFQGWTSESFARHGKTLWEHQYVLMAKDLV